MKFLRHATANWQGTGKEGTGKISTQSATLNDAPLTFKTRFGDGKGTNPEELIAAGHAGCITMKMSFVLNSMGFTADNIDSKVTITLDSDIGAITVSTVEITASVPGISEEDFQKAATETKENCMISKLLNCDIDFSANLAL